MDVFSVRKIGRSAVLGGALVVLGCTGGKGVKWAESTAPAVRVNQLGYFPMGPKWATLRGGGDQALPVELRQKDQVLWKGTSVPRGDDEASGDQVQWIDFSEFQGAKRDLTLHVGSDVSFPFAIEDDIYARLPFDALKYFYHNRSGVPITMPYAEDVTFTRPAGHLSDTKVPCWDKGSCSYTLNVSGGWYDAGDHGKYVVNGGISAWTLLALYERLGHLSHTASAWGDSTLNIPESGNGVPDLLDEARFEVEFLLRMQVPMGQPLAGMAHHKVHDNAWSALGIEPPPVADNRALHAPSTAATLNLAAVAAQAARIFKKWDPAFASFCVQASEIAYQAAVDHPNLLASDLDKQGGGPYSDRYVADEFFWAASELFITTNKALYFEAMRKSEHFAHFPSQLNHPDGGADGDGVSASMTWQSTAALGWISLAVAPSSLADTERQRMRDGIVASGNVFLKAIEGEGYRLPMSLGESKKYPWGSNSFVLNNMVVLSLAHDFTGERKFAEGVAQGMDYLLGRNAMVQSYITGYGSMPLTSPHHRFWAHSINPQFPRPPAGAISGGPNSSLQDPQTKKSGLYQGLPPQKCFVDHIEAWSVNEITINWNAPLVWSAIFLNEWRGR
jgi:endoglucanase